MPIRTFPRLIGTLFALSLWNAAFAEDAVLTHVSGKVTVNGKPAKKDDRVKMGQTIRTPEGSTAIVSAAKGTVKLKMDAGSALRLHAPDSKSAKDMPPVEAELGLGGVIADVKAALDKSRPAFRIRTKSATMGVRGTRFYAALNGTGKDKDVWMCVDEGEVEISDVKSGKTVPVKAGLGVHFPKDGEITEPKPYEWTKKLNWNMDPKEGKVENSIQWNSVYGDPLLQHYD